MLSTREIEASQLSDEIAELASHIAAATARWLALLARLDAIDGWCDGYKSLAHWLAWRCGMSLGTARDHVRTALALTKRPLIRAAFERGELSYSKVRALMRLEEDFDEQLMLDYARCASASQLETIVRGCRRCVAVEQGAERQYAERSFGWHFDDDGALVFWGRLPAEEGAVVVRAIEAARDELGPPPKEFAEEAEWSLREATASHAARRADAFVAVARSALAERASSADVYQVVVHVDANALTKDAHDGIGRPSAGADAAVTGRCHLENGEPLSTQAVRRLICDASIVTALERDGNTISLGRKARTVNGSLRRALQMRDRGCAFPGCTQRHHTDAHHIEHWADGGKTRLDNLVQLCRHHHMLIHNGRFGIQKDGDGFAFLRADGTRIPQAPRPPRGDADHVKRDGPGAGRRTRWSLFPVEANPRAELGWAVSSMLEARRE